MRDIERPGDACCLLGGLILLFLAATVIAAFVAIIWY